MKKTKVIYFVLILLLISCDKKEDDINVNTIILNGNVDLIDQFGETIQNESDIEIKINETGAVSKSDSKGRYAFNGLVYNDIYHFSFSKHNFTEIPEYEFEFKQNVEMDDIVLSELSDHKFDSLYTYFSLTFCDIFLYCSASGDKNRKGIAYYSDNKNVTNLNYIFKKEVIAVPGDFPTLNFFSQNEWNYTIYDTVYVRIYPIPVGDYTRYIDENGLEIDPGIDKNNSLFYEIKIE